MKSIRFLFLLSVIFFSFSKGQSQALCGVYTVGVGGNFLTLGNAVRAADSAGISCSVIFEITPLYNIANEIFPVVIPELNTSVSNTVTFRPQNPGLTLSSAYWASMFVLDSCDYIIFDGRAGGLGSQQDWTLINTSTTGVIFQFRNGAQHNTISNLNICGSNTSEASGPVFIGGTNNLNGNSFNLLINNKFFPQGNTANHIYANGTVNAMNEFNRIDSNEFSDWFKIGSSHSAIMIKNGNSKWSFTGNHFYQTVTRNLYGATTLSAININAVNGSGFSIVRNYFGGTAPFAAGGRFQSNYNSSTSNFLITLLQIETATNKFNSIQGNTFQNFGFTSVNGMLTFTAIGSYLGKLRIGDSLPNILGSTLVDSSFLFHSNTSGGDISLIGLAAPDSLVLQNNFLGSVSIHSTSAPHGLNAYMLSVHGGIGTHRYVLVEGNTFGGDSLGKFVIGSFPNTGQYVGNTSLINITSSEGDVFVRNNILRNLTSFNSGNNKKNLGILIYGNFVIENNLIYNLKATGNIWLMGILSTSNDNHHGIIRNNTIHTIQGEAQVQRVAGIYYGGLNASGDFSGNKISHLALNNPVGRLVGIESSSSSLQMDIWNNMISISNAPFTTAVQIIGINMAGHTNLHHNSVYLEGNMNSPTVKTFALLFGSPHYQVFTFRNNLLINNITGSGKNLAVGSELNFMSWPQLVSAPDGNVYANVNHSEMAMVGMQVYSFAGWKSYFNSSNAHGDSNSCYGFSQSFSGIFADKDSADLRIVNTGISAVGLIESNGVSSFVLQDTEGDNRPGPSGSQNGGGTHPDSGADEFDGTPVFVDLSLEGLAYPTLQDCYDSQTTVRFRIKNQSPQSISFQQLPVTLLTQVTGPNPEVFQPLILNSGILQPFSTLDTAVDISYDMSLDGVYIFHGLLSAYDSNFTNNIMLADTLTSNRGYVWYVYTQGCHPAAGYFMDTLHNGSIQWEVYDSLNLTWVQVPFPGSNQSVFIHTPQQDGLYRAQVCPGRYTDSIRVEAFQVLLGGLSLIDSACFGGTANLQLPQGTYGDWYVDSLQSPIFSGSTFHPVIQSDTTFYVKTNQFSETHEQIGPRDSTIGTQFNAVGGSSIRIVKFNVYDSLIIREFTFYPASATTYTLKVFDQNGVQYGGVAVSVTPSELGAAKKVYVNWILPPGNNYRIQSTGGGNLYYSQNIVPFLYEIPGLMKIIPYSNPTFHWFFYNIQVERICNVGTNFISVPVYLKNPAPVNILPSPIHVCPEGDTLQLMAQSINTSYAYTWSPPSAIISTFANSALVWVDGTFPITLSASDNSGCTATDTVFFGLYSSPTVTLNGSAMGIAGDTLLFSAGGGLNYYWSSAGGNFITGTMNDTVELIYQSPGNYTVQVIVTDSNGCADTVTMAISIYPAPDLSLEGLSFPTMQDCYSLNTTVRFQIKNQTSQSISFQQLPVTLYTQATGPNSEIFQPLLLNSGSIGPFGTLDTAVDYTFNMGSDGMYIFNGNLVVADGNSPNNTMQPDTLYNTPGQIWFAYSHGCENAIGYFTDTLHNGSVQWEVYDSLNLAWLPVPAPGSNQPIFMYAPSQDGIYRAEVCPGRYSDSIRVEAFLPLSVLPPVSDSACAGASVNLSLPPGEIGQWFTDTLQGAVYTGNNFNPIIYSDTIFYVKPFTFSGTAEQIGPRDSTIGNQFNAISSNSTQTLTFSTFDSLRVREFTIYPGQSANYTIEVADINGVVHGSTTIFIQPSEVGQAKKVFVNWALSPGNQYNIYSANGGSLYYSQNIHPFLYEISGLLEIIPYSNPNIYWFFYDIQVERLCYYPNFIAIPSFLSSPAPLSIYPSLLQVCAQGDTVQFSVSSTNTGYQYTWGPVAAIIAAQGNQALVLADTAFPVTVIAIDGSGCLNADTAYIELYSSPGVFINGPSNAVQMDTLVFFGGTGSNYYWSAPGASFIGGNTGDTVRLTYALPGAYTIQMYITNTNGCLDTVTSTILINSLAVENNAVLKPDIFVYPVPAKDYIWISIPDIDSGRGKISLWDMRGRLLYENILDLAAFNPFYLSVGKFAPGVYLIHVEQDNWKEIQQIVITPE